MILLNGKMEEQLLTLEDNSVDSVVTDPPYGISFMGKGWDHGVPNAEMWKEVYRVLKPGGYVLSFSSARTYHRSTVGIEDAGFEIRDQIMWVYGSGFPKSHNIGKSHDKKMGVESSERHILPTTTGVGPFEGWGTALKPAHEPITVARKPFKGTVVDNMMTYGVGGINIDASRIGTEPIKSNGYASGMKGGVSENGVLGTFNPDHKPTINEGRFPANIIHDGSQGVLDLFPSLTGGSAARFFYVPKVNKKDRNEGLGDGFSEELKSNDGRTKTNDTAYQRGNAVALNSHPTVKPTDLMHYLIRMVTPSGGIVLDPFMGSGSTGKAAIRHGYDFVGIEMEEHSFEIAKARIENEQ